MTTSQLSDHYVGLVLYTFQDLFTRGETVISLVESLQRLFPDVHPSLFRAVAKPIPGQSPNDFIRVPWSTLQSDIEAGKVARFQAQDNEDTTKTVLLLRVALDGAGSTFMKPNYLLAAFSADYFAEHAQEASKALLAFAQEAFARLEAVYGYAHIGVIRPSSHNEGNAAPAPLSPDAISFTDLDADGDFSSIIKGAFWANLLNREHVENLGGIETIKHAAPWCRTENLAGGGLILVSNPSPIPWCADNDPGNLVRLEKLLAPIAWAALAQSIPEQDAEEQRYTDIGLQTLMGHVQRFEEEYLKVGKVARNHVWRPYRFCTQDVILGLAVVCHSPEKNRLEVDVCLITELPEYEPHNGAKVTTVFLLTEAYKCGGTMEIHFTNNVEGGRVPKGLCLLAQDLGVELNHVDEGRITPAEARQFYFALTQLSPSLQDRLLELAGQGRLSLERACYVVQHGIWSRPEVEAIVLGSQRPDSIFGGESLPEQRHLYLHDLLHARAALLGGFLDRVLAKRQRGDASTAVDLEDDVRPLDIAFDASSYAKVYQCSEPLSVPWLAEQGQTAVSPDRRLVALVRARDEAELILHFQEDLAAAGAWAEAAKRQPAPDTVFILTPRNFDELPANTRNRFLADARSRGVGIIVCPELTTSLDADAARRLTSSRIIRQ